MANKNNRNKPAGNRGGKAAAAAAAVTVTAAVSAAPPPSPAPAHYAVGRYITRTAAPEGASPEEAAKHRDFVTRERLMAIRASSLKRQAVQTGSKAGVKVAGFLDGSLGPANIGDSENIGYYSYEFPVDSLEMPQSRPEEMRFYRLAYDRDPLASRGINLHTELPLSKMQLEKPKSSVEPFSDYVFDFYQRLMNDTQLFQALIEATREYNLIGESFLYIIQPDSFKNLKLPKETIEALKKGRGFAAGISPMNEAENAPLSGQEGLITEDWIQAKRKFSKLYPKAAKEKLFDTMLEEGIDFDDDEHPAETIKEIRKTTAKIAKFIREQKSAANDLVRLKIASKMKVATRQKVAAPGDPPAGAPVPGAAADAVADAPLEGAPEGGPEDGAEDAGVEGGADAGFAGGAGGGFAGGVGGGGGIDDEPIDGEEHALAEEADQQRAREINELKRYLHLLERKRELLEEYKDIREKREAQKEIFSHCANPEYEGFIRIQHLAPEKIELASDSSMGPDPVIMYKPTEDEKAALLADTNLDADTRATLEEKSQLRLNTDPFKGPYVLHLARKKAGYELHGRSVLQSCMRTLIYREKLRQVQTTLASRNMTPKTIVTAPGVAESQIDELRALVDEAKSDPDFTIVANYDINWNEISNQGRLLALDGEYQHLNSDLSIGLGFSPEILVGEGLYGGNRIQLEILNTTYTQYRETLTNLIENHIFKPLAMIKGFYETDNYGRPRWVYPKITFGRMALRDSGDVYEMLYNLYSKGSLPVSIILDFLNIDPETVKRELENDLFTVNDSKFNELLSNLYGQVSQDIIKRTDLVNRLAKGLTLQEQDVNKDPIEGTGEGM